MRDYIKILEAIDKPTELTNNPLPYAIDELAPVMSSDTLEYHWGKLAKGYADRYNKGEGDADFNLAGNYLHNLLFAQFEAPAGANRPKGAVLELINRKFGDFRSFQKTLEIEAMKLQGSGWIYLSRTGEIKTIKNHDVRKDILLLIDWWEHAWSLDYQADKQKYLKNIYKLINWDIINQRF
jgi:Fe-Mn family superoxide dismutase